MGKTRKREVRRKFREAVFKRDGFKCIGCGYQSSPEKVDHELDAHHITPREEMPNGGYVPENGVSLCDPAKSGGKWHEGCHFKAETNLRRLEEGFEPSEYNRHLYPDMLYKAIGSSRKKAEQASEFL